MQPQTSIDQQPQNTEASDEVLQQLLEEMTDRAQELSASSVNAMVARYPAHESAIRSMAATVYAIHSFRPDESQPNTADQPACAAGVPGKLGDYRILREIARGGMGLVFEAEQLSLSRRVALKILPAASLLDAVQVARFRNESLAAAQLQHPHIVSVYDVGVADGVHYYAMQFIDGQNLAELLSKRDKSDGFAATDCQIDSAVQFELPQLPEARCRFVANIGLQAATALAYAHRVGVVHRDIKPSNLIVDSSGKLWITDFGLARIGVDTGLTATGNIVGTLRYMSPEQAAGNGRSVDYRTDILALGVTMYEVLTDRPMRSATSTDELLRQVLDAKAPHFASDSRSIPLDLRTIILKCTEREPDGRYQSADELADDLQAFLDHRPIRAQPASWSGQIIKWGRRNPVTTRWLVACAFFFSLIVGVASVWISSERQARKYEQRLLAQKETQLAAELLRSRNASYVTNIKLAAHHWQRSGIPEMRQHLERCKPVAGESDLRGFEWYYLQALVDSIPRPIGKHQGMAYYVEFIPGTRDFVTAGDDGLRVWKDFQEFKFIAQPPLGSQWIDFSADGAQMLSASGKQVVLWDTSTWTAIRSYECELVALAAEFVPDQGTAVIVEREENIPSCRDSLVRLIDLETGENRWRHYEAGSAEMGQLAEGLAVSPLRNLIVVPYSLGQLVVMDLGTGTVLSSYISEGLKAVSCSPDETHFAVASGGGMISIWRLDAQLERPILRFKADGGAITSLQFYHQEQILASSGDGSTVDFGVSLKPGKVGHKFRKRYGYSAPLWACRLNAQEDRFLATVDRLGYVTIRDCWEPDIQNPQILEGRDFSGLSAEQKLAYAAGSISFDASADANLAVTHDRDQTFFLWDLNGNVCTRRVTVAELRKYAAGIPQEAHISTTRFLPDSKRIAIWLRDYAIVVYDIATATSRPWFVATDSSTWYSYPLFQPSGNLAAAQAGGAELNGAFVFDVETGKLVRRLRGGIVHLEWGHDGTYLIQDGWGGDFVVTDTATWEDRFQFVGSRSSQPAISPDGRTLATSEIHKVVLWNLPSGRELLRIPFEFVEFSSRIPLRFSDGGRRLTAESAPGLQAYLQLDPPSDSLP